MQEPKFRVEEPVREHDPVFLNDEEYGDAIRSFIIVCTDFVPINREKKLIYLAKRIVHSTKGIWRFGGRQKAFETTRESCSRLAKRELGLDILLERFDYVMMSEDVWAWRKQPPEEAGGHNLTHVFSVEFSEEELARASLHLDPEEYDLEFGIQAFDIKSLNDARVRDQLIDVYNAIFTE